jgi:hypothetical protein
MAVAITALKPLPSRRNIQKRYSLALTGNYATGGVALDLSTILNPSFYEAVNFGGPGLPALSQFSVVAPAGYEVEVVSSGVGSPTLATGFLLKFYTTAATEVAAGAFPAGLTGSPTYLTVSVNSYTQV